MSRAQPLQANRPIAALAQQTAALGGIGFKIIQPTRKYGKSAAVSHRALRYYGYATP